MDRFEFGNKCAELIQKSNRILVFTGAGVSTASGIPDYRSPGGIWSRYRPVYFDEFLNSEEARIRYWSMKKESYELYKTASPNFVHHFICRLQTRNKLLGLCTQNIDGLHRISGIDPDKLIELHGTDREISCLSCHKRFEAQNYFETFDPQQPAPACSCGSYVKPATISFGQSLNSDDMDQCRAWCEAADLCLVLGSSLQVQPAASIPMMCMNYGASLVIINKETTSYDDFALLNIRDDLGEVLKGVDEKLKEMEKEFK